MIQFKNLTLKRGVKVLIESASLQLHPGHKVGLTGANGAGKSSIFAMLRFIVPSAELVWHLYCFAGVELVSTYVTHL